MSATINIVPAMEADLPLIAKLAVTSMSVHLLFRIIYPSNNPLDTTKAEHDVLKDLQHQAKNPAARIFKACSTENGADIVGYMMFRFADGPIDDVIAPASDKIVSSAAAEATTKLGNDGGTTNVAFLSKVSSLLKPAYARHMGGKAHICKSFPTHLLEWAMSNEISADAPAWDRLAPPVGVAALAEKGGGDCDDALGVQ